MKERKIKQGEKIVNKKLPILAIIILSILIIISLYGIWLSFRFFFAEESVYAIFGLVVLVPSLPIFILSIPVLLKKESTRKYLMGVLTFFSFYLLSIVLGSINMQEKLIGIVSAITLIFFILTIAYFGKNKKVREAFN